MGINMNKGTEELKKLLHEIKNMTKEEYNKLYEAYVLQCEGAVIVNEQWEEFYSDIKLEIPDENNT